MIKKTFKFVLPLILSLAFLSCGDSSDDAATDVLKHTEAVADVLEDFNSGKKTTEEAVASLEALSEAGKALQARIDKIAKGEVQEKKVTKEEKAVYNERITKAIKRMTDASLKAAMKGAESMKVLEAMKIAMPGAAE